MPSVCILTDSTAQFTRPNFPGHELVYVIPFEFQPMEAQGRKGLPTAATARRLVPPSVHEFLRFYTQLSRNYDTVLVLTLSSHLSPTTGNAREAAVQHSNHASVMVVDSQTIAVGLGLLVQSVANAAAGGASLQEIDHWVRAAIPKVYMLFCIPELTYLARTGYLTYSQARVGEMIGMFPIFALEEGRLSPLEKVRTQRHLFESFQEFMEEFENPGHIALLHGAGHTTLRTRPLRTYVQENFPKTPFSEHAIGPHVAALFGPQSIGLVIMENI
jgi:fatty acid kinase fatty acid binding subunit